MLTRGMLAVIFFNCLSTTRADFFVVDLRTLPGPKWPGQIVDAGFFDENWK